jgi:hypothetical protein
MLNQATAWLMPHPFDYTTEDSSFPSLRKASIPLHNNWRVRRPDSRLTIRHFLTYW